ncbi:MAG: Rne/Rng family ribonuclease [Deltaproteobacteria bacterium]|nr:Rne/Rng family ribonuclease [Deltaproteobacteria bacterium]
MARKLLINAIHPEETRIAIVENERLIELDVEHAEQVQLKGNIYKSPITRIEPSLQAAFLDIGSSRNGFLQINDIHPAYYENWQPPTSGRYHRPAIQDVLRAGQELVVQVVKDERELKGATLTTNISIPGRYLVLMIGNQRGGVSRKIIDIKQRKRLRQAVDGLRVPAGMGVIVRTAGINKTTAELQKDIDSLVDTWQQIVEKSLTLNGPIALYQESALAIRTIRDYLTSEIDEILIDEKNVYDQAYNFINKVMPKYINKLSFYEERQPLFSKFLIDSQIETINQPEVVLPSGGSIVINTTEAVVTVDVNSGRSTGQSDVEETAFATNKEAAVEVARQLRLRDLGGLVVIDFIDMNDHRHKQVIERTVKDVVKTDKAKVEVGRISKFGLLELSRQRLKSSLISQSHVTCPHCDGRGRVKTAEVVALEVLIKIQSSVFSGGISSIRVRMSPAPALYLLNNKKQIISDLETNCHVNILVLADGRMKPDQYELELVTERGDTQHHEVGATPTRSESDDSGGERPRPRQNNRKPRGGYGKQEHNRRQSNDRGGYRGGRQRNRRYSNRPYRNDRGPAQNNEAPETPTTDSGQNNEPNQD